MEDYTIRNILDSLKNRLDKNSEIGIQATQGYCYTGKCTFNKPATNEEIDKFILDTGWSIPDEYRKFLLIHNGANFFSFEYGGASYLYGIDEIISNASLSISKNLYIIGLHSDLGDIVIDSKRVKEGRKDYMLLSSDEIIDFKCDFKTWLDRMIITYGINYWEWRSKKVPLDDILNE